MRDAIFSQMLVPLIQGTLRYLWKTDTAFGAASNKELGELWAFSTAILPMLDSVNPTAANALYNRAWGTFLYILIHAHIYTHVHILIHM